MNIADRIERRLEEARAALATDAREAVNDARQLTDWRAHVRRHPWAACGGATALGFLLVPRHRRQRSAQAERAEPATAEPLTYQGMGPGSDLLRRCLDVAIVAVVEQTFRQFGGQTQVAMDGQSSRQPSPNGSAAASAAESIEPQRVPASEPESSIAARLAEALEQPLNSAAATVRQTVAKHPAQSLAAAVVAGVIVGVLAKRR
jgi:ElaB/YqjD/DUF883 family membrane-anchored ribosome-binding protein